MNLATNPKKVLLKYEIHNLLLAPRRSDGFFRFQKEKKIRLNAGYFITIYEDYTKTYTAAQGGYMGTGYPGSETFSRTNHVIGVGVDFKF